MQSEIARLFGVDGETASNIISAMPIVVLDGLSAQVAGVVRERIHHLTALGCRITTSDEESDNIPRVNWPELPPIARVEPDELSRSSGTGPSMPRGPAGLQCPSCGSPLRLVADSNGAARAHTSSATAKAPQQAPRAQAQQTPRSQSAPPAPAPAPAPQRSPAQALAARPAARDAMRVPLEDDDWLAPSSRPAGGETNRRTSRFDNPALLGRSSPPPAKKAQEELQVEFGAMSSGTHNTLNAPTQPPPGSPSKRDRMREAMGGSSDLANLDSSSSASPLDMIEDSIVGDAAPPSTLEDSDAALAALDPLDDPLGDLEGSGGFLGDSGSLLGKPPAERARARQLPDDDDDLDDLLIDSESASSAPELPSLEDSQDPSLEEVLGMFGPEDEEPLDDGSGLDPVPLDLSSASNRPARSSSSPFEEEMSDILEPLNPAEARQIMRSHSGRAPQRSSTASHLRLNDEPSDLEPLDPSEAFAILGGGDRPRAKKKSRGVPRAATDEDVSTGKKKTDPFARARRNLEDAPRKESRRNKRESAKRESVKRESPKKRESTRLRNKKRESGKTSRPSKKVSGRSKRPSGKVRRSGGPPPNGKGNHGLVLSRLSDPDKKEQAAQLIAEIKGCSIDEAERLTDRTIIPVLKGVSREVAEYHLERFKDNDIAGRVTTRQRS